MKRLRNLSLASVNLPDINDKLGVLSGLAQYLGNDGRMSAGDVNGITFYVAQLSPSVVAANSESTQTFIVAGLGFGDGLIVIKPTKQAGLSLMADSFVPTTNTLSLTFRNFTGGGITPTANERYVIVGFRN